MSIIPVGVYLCHCIHDSSGKRLGGLHCWRIRILTTARPLAGSLLRQSGKPMSFSSPRVETVIIRLPSLSDYHRLNLPGLVSAIFIIEGLDFVVYIRFRNMPPQDTSAPKNSSSWPPARSEKSDTSVFFALTASKFSSDYTPYLADCY